MKIKYFYRTLLPFLLAFFNVIGGNAYSYNSAIPDLDPRNYDYLQEDQNTSALYIQEISARGPAQIFSKNDLLPGYDLISGKGFFFRSSSDVNKLTSIIIRDKKEILKTYIFPFHFFW
ncbi:MAG TPA: hypothetical protein VLN46_06445 [Gillisia sp.]|nr:hypothetical protein [Gillisia sp.]